jgi:acyl-CoA synthetase (AMP-forming)/AMP-acid ligase II
LLERCSVSLARYKTPREVIILEALPKNSVGKIDKRALRQLVGAAANNRAAG